MRKFVYKIKEYNGREICRVSDEQTAEQILKCIRMNDFDAFDAFNFGHLDIYETEVTRSSATKDRIMEGVKSILETQDSLVAALAHVTDLLEQIRYEEPLSASKIGDIDEALIIADRALEVLEDEL